MIKTDELKKGVTTGSCVTAGVKAGLEALFNDNYEKNIQLQALNSEWINLEVLSLKESQDGVRVSVRKYSGDDPDVTNNIEICVRVKFISHELEKELDPEDIEKGFLKENVFVTGGRGVGISTKAGLQVPIGKYAINPGPLKMINKIVADFKENAVLKTDDFNKENGKEHIDFEKGYFIIKIFVPQGIKKSKLTLNSKLGVIGGISILGSTGIVKPMSEDSLKVSLYTEMKVIRESSNRDWVVFSFGNYGEKFCESIGIKKDMVVIISNYIGFMLEGAVKLGFKKVILVGHIGKAVKIAGGIFNTHSKVADARLEIMGANAFLFNESNETIRKILDSNTVDEASKYIENKEFFNYLSEKVSSKSNDHVHKELKCESLIFDFDGNILGYSKEFYTLINEILKQGDEINLHD
ncbi:MAG: cobalt-precorrin-5B (C(1))-methyltransferase CbiD [Fusobacteriaceae bacterium]